MSLVRRPSRTGAVVTALIGGVLGFVPAGARAEIGRAHV